MHAQAFYFAILLAQGEFMKESEKNKGAQAMAQLRAKSLSPERRTEIAKKAAQKRWGTKKKSAKK
jgi:hypothetical protein